MITETQLIERLRNRLLALGYPADALRAEVRTDYSRSADLVVYETGKPKVVFEVKVNLDPLSLADEVRLPFNPAVRQAQFLASELGAPYFAVFDGEQILWFDIDDRDGRPRLLSGAVGPSTEAAPIQLSGDSETALRLVYTLYDLVIGIWGVPKTLAFVGITLLSKLRAELHGGSPAEQLSMLGHQVRSDDVPLQNIYSQFKREDLEYFTRAFLILDGITLSHIPFPVFARALDEVLFNHRKDIGVFKLPVWLLDLIALLAQPGSTDSVLDIYSNYGDGVSAISRLSETVRITSVTPNNISYLWDLLKRLRLGLSPRDLIYANLPDGDTLPPELRSQRFDRVLVVSPFVPWVLLKKEGRRVALEEFFLLTALDWIETDGRVVALLPENFLFSQRHQQARDSILESMRLRAVISLEQFMPGTAVKASIVVLDDRSNNSNDQRVVMLRFLNEEINTLKELQQFIQDYGPIQTVIALLTEQAQGDRFPESENLWLTDSRGLISSSWAVTSHLPPRVIESDSLFPVVPLGRIATLRKGANLTLDRNGPLLVIGPASVRPLVIEPTELDRTTKERLPKRPVVAQSGDVLIHAVGNYRGGAAVVGPDFEGFHISRNIVVARPDPSIISPEYLAIALNGKFVRQQLGESSAGSVIPLLTIGLLETALIPVPDLETQRVIVDQVEDARRNHLSAEERLSLIEAEVRQVQERFQTLIDTFHQGGGLDV